MANETNMRPDLLYILRPAYWDALRSYGGCRGDGGSRGVRPGRGACSVVPSYGGTHRNISLPARDAPPWRVGAPGLARSHIKTARAALCLRCGFQFLDMTPGPN